MKLDLGKRFERLPAEMKKIFLADIRTAMDERLKVMERLK